MVWIYFFDKTFRNFNQARLNYVVFRMQFILVDIDKPSDQPLDIGLFS